ncbi:helix-turn-helix domain-containing protein [Embleya scabrispora]|uniref:helix-turn-helix domain-containing protein n=1 Tax=Embleya scabrispora TaxID=159449 RepID=UPI00036A4CCE|nr:helix-turn-helix domain-containing protein [Embleya scabrispora]MYS80020.1 helix-turn-helix domain-containing protein [Streptomyces sp. SID5474]
MVELRPPWDAPRVRLLAARGDVGGLVRVGRLARNWRQRDLGSIVGYSASTVSRLESGARSGRDVAVLRRLAAAVDMPVGVLGAALGVSAPLPARVGRTAVRREEEDDSMRRRRLLTASLAAVPVTMLGGVDQALASIPTRSSPTTGGDVLARLRCAHGWYDSGDHARLVAALPELLAAGHTHADTAPGDQGAFARLAACYDLATEMLSKIGHYQRARTAADRATVYAHQSGSPLAAASSARMLSIVLRHQGQEATAQRVTLDAAARVEGTGLTTPEQAAAYAQMLCTAAYTCAGAGDRANALELMADAKRAVRRVPAGPEARTVFTVTPASVGLYEVGVLYSLGDAGAALHAGRRLHPEQFPTAERRGRLHTDMARAWWQLGKAEQTADALAAAHREAPGEVRDRPSIRGIVTDLARRHPNAIGVRDLLTATRTQ